MNRLSHLLVDTQLFGFGPACQTTMSSRSVFCLRHGCRSRHRPAAFGAFPARGDALGHVADAFAVLRALGTFRAEMGVMGRTDQHEMRRCPADLRTRHHQCEVLLPGVGAAHFEAMAHGHRQAGRIAGQAVVDAALHPRVDMVHVHAPSVCNVVRMQSMPACKCSADRRRTFRALCRFSNR